MIKIECLRELKWNMCNDCPFYDKETGECKATIKQIKEINEREKKKEGRVSIQQFEKLPDKIDSIGRETLEEYYEKNKRNIG